MGDPKFVGQPLPLLDAPDRVQGRTVFAADLQMPRMAVAQFLASPYAHAEIVSIDTTAARALPGVRAVVTGADLPRTGFDPKSRDHCFMARRFAVYAGQPVAAVAADDLETAEAALQRIAIEWRPLPVISDPHAALQPDSPPIARESVPGTTLTAGEQGESPNLACRYVIEHGDVQAAIAGSDAVVEGTYVVPMVHQGYIEPHAAVAWWDRTDHVTVWECVQSAFEARDLIGEVLDIAPTCITVRATEVGGAFGGKYKGLFGALAVLLAQKAGRPVKLVVSRRQELTAANPAPYTSVWVRTGARQDGTLTAIETRVLFDAGAFPTDQSGIGVSVMVAHDYRFQAWRLESLEVVTNRAPTGSYRAPGAVNANVPIELQMDELAHRLGLDPIAFRLKNVVQEGETMVTMRTMGPHGANEVLSALAAHPAWTEPLPRQDDGLLRGRGVALGSWSSGRWPASAAAYLEADGKIRLVLGQVNLTGSYTSLAQIAADTFGVSVSRILVIQANTDHAGYAPVSGGSGAIYSMGSAVAEAVLDLRAKVLRCAAAELEAPEAGLVISDEGVYVAADPERLVPFKQLYQLGTHLFLAKYGPLAGQGSLRLKQGSATFAASIAEVAVDPETGQVILTRLVTAQDVGKAINPMSVEGQIQGAAAQSAGMALWEMIAYDEQGRVRNPNLLDYRQPTAADVPAIEAVIIEAPGGAAPFGAKGVGEPPMIPPAAAVANAVAAAIGSRVCELPLTAERVWRAIRDRQDR